MSQPSSVSLAELVYQRLDELTDGIEAFLTAGRDEVWTGKPYKDFHITTLWPDRRIMFGFRTEINGDQGPDPIIAVSLDEGRARFNDMIIDTLAGYFKGTDGAATGSDAYCAEFLEEMCARKRRGLFTAVSGVAYVPEERDYETAYTARPRG